MKFSAQVLMLALMAGATLLTGCRKKPVRPNPWMTNPGMGETGTGSGLPVTDVTGFGNDAPALRGEGWDSTGANRTLLQPVYFDFDRASIKSSERPKLEAAVTYLRDNPQMRLLLEGHCDWRGTAEYNLGLGDRRAASVKKYLTDLGVDTTKMETLSKGDLDAVENASDTQMAEDRRVELVVVAPQGAAPAPLQ